MKKTLARLVALILVCQVVTSLGMMPEVKAAGQRTRNFTDMTTTDWYYDNVMTLVQDSREIIQGYNDGSFRPNNELTLEEFVTMIIRACGFTLEEVPGDWSKNYMDKAEELGFNLWYLTSFLDKKKTDPITREEMCILIVDAMTYLEGDHDLKDLSQVDQVVTDIDEINYGIKEEIRIAYKMGIIMGYESDNSFRPKKVLNRAEASTVIIRMIDKTKREVFDYEKLYNQVHGNKDFESHFLGGENWLDPLNVTLDESVQVDRYLVTSDMKIGPNDYELTHNVTHPSMDYVQGVLMFSKAGRDQGRIDDFERLLLRRVNEDEVQYVMDYINQMQNWDDRLPAEETAIFLEESNYLVNFLAPIKMEGTQWEKSNSVSFGIYFRDENFIDKHELGIAGPIQGVYIHILRY